MAASSDTNIAADRGPALGALTRTIVRSPVIRCILPARIRHPRLNDVVFVGDDFIEVKQVKQEGYLEHVATKSDFGSRIRAAKTFSNGAERPDEDTFLNDKQDYDSLGTPTVPPQFLVLSLDCDDILFLYLQKRSDGQLEFKHQRLPLPTWPTALSQAGEHLAVDPHSRAVAIAARERELVLCSAKPRHSIQHELEEQQQNWCPVGKLQKLPVQGVIQHMDFLNPPANDTDHVILLLIVVDDRKTRAIWIDWHYSTGIHQLQQHAPQPIDAPKCVSSLLIPLCDAAFLLIHGDDIVVYKDILSGCMTPVALSPPPHQPKYPGNSPKLPGWANWCRPLRNKTARLGKDFIYLAREDGIVVLVEIKTSPDFTVQTSSAGDLECHVGEAFASLGDPFDPDILAVAGDMSTGRIVSMGHWATARRLSEMSRVDTMYMQTMELIPNWGSVTDMATSTLPHSHSKPPRLRDSIFLVSGRQPFGTFVEIRKGLEARMLAFLPIQDLRVVTDVWALPNPGNGSAIIFLSTPTSTRLFHMSAEGQEVEEVDGQQTSSFDTLQRTLAADVTPAGHLIQVTERAICLAASLEASFEDRFRKQYDEHESVVAAAIEPSLGLIVCAEKRGSNFAISCYQHGDEGNAESALGFEDALRTVGEPVNIDAEPLCLATARVNDQIFILVATAAGDLRLLTCDNERIQETVSVDMPEGEQNLSDHVVLLRPVTSEGTEPSELLAICGLRNGDLFTLRFDPEREAVLDRPRVVEFGQSTVKLVRHSNEPDRAYAMSGLDTCLLTFDEAATDHLTIRSIWMSDKGRPELGQGQVLACTLMPHPDFLFSDGLADALIIISGDELCFATLETTPTTVPRQIGLSGTPFRLLYAESQRCWVCASLFFNTRQFPSSRPHGRPEDWRQMFPVIDFIPSNWSRPSFTHRLQPGEQVFALLEWAPKLFDDRTFSFILLGGMYLRNGNRRGKILFLQPKNTDWVVTDATERRTMSFDSPVYALARYDDLTFVACSGKDVVAYRFSPEDRKWDELCAPCRLSSLGIAVSCSAPLVYVSTSEDSMVTLRMEPRAPGAGREHPFALVPVCMGPRADKGLAHAAVQLAAQLHNDSEPDARTDTIALTTTRFGEIVGLTSPPPDLSPPNSRARSARLLFEAQLPRSLTRLQRCRVRPAWKPRPPPGVLTTDLVGCAADGSVLGLALLAPELWRRLAWLQRLCEWSPMVSPHSHEAAPYSVGDDDDGYDDDDGHEGSDYNNDANTNSISYNNANSANRSDQRAQPIGLGPSTAGEEIILFATSGSGGGVSDAAARDMHVDGDVLARLLERGGAEALRRVLAEAARRPDRVGAWVRTHLDEEMAAVEGVVAELRILLDAWA